ncbi:retrovirus-related pol polyprotein [Lentinula edodes]|uniref:Retrovirus-related pol polyprotein n=1 Tax=Lentinula edodes TaxID=5353 RepID=A0A1Q3ESH5_LENED|nr:retrovirus-related pol polyprotein [Lentinula edodes]
MSLSTGNQTATLPTFPESFQLSGQDTWKAFKDRVELNVEFRGLKGYLHGTIPKPSPATYVYTSITPSFPSSLHLSPEEWNQRKRLVAAMIYLNCTDPIGSRDEELILLTNTALREQKYDPATTTMEDHEKKMNNLLKRLRNLGGAVDDFQYRLIVIKSMPKEWKENVLNVPGRTSSEAFTYLKHLYINKVEPLDNEDQRIQKKVAALVAPHIAAHPVIASAVQRRNRPVCTNPSCPRKLSHSIENCWAKGGGGEGNAPKSWKDKYENRTAASSSTTASSTTILTDPDPTDLYVHTNHVNISAKPDSKELPF